MVSLINPTSASGLKWWVNYEDKSMSNSNLKYKVDLSPQQRENLNRLLPRSAADH